MATVTSLTPDDQTQVSWIATNGNVITFRVQSTISTDGDLCIPESVSFFYHTNFPTDIPELHFSIVEDTGGSATIAVDETIDVTIPSDIYQAVAVKLVVKEGGDIKKETVYHENPIEIRRPIGEKKVVD